MSLSTEQMLLLNNLMYMAPGEGSPLMRAESFEGQSIGEWINNIDVSKLADSKNYGSFMTGQDWKNIISAVKQDNTLMNMTIATTHVDNAAGGGGGSSALFLSNTGDAVVVFRGTASGEWTDNFIGGNVTDTPQQQNALDWYQDVYKEYGLDNYEVTVSGHSKGGNKAKYITVLDDTVDHCVSFDGQGFSDKFIDKYSDQIAVEQGKIENHNVDYDYVNLLLNDIGETTYYEGQDLGQGGFLENHAPNTFMDFNGDGTFSMPVNPNGQGPEMKALDEFLNNYLRSMTDGQKNDALLMVNAIIDNAFSIPNNATAADIANLYLQMAADPKYADDLAYFLAYTIKYEQANPEFAGQIRGLLKELGMGDYVEYVDIVEGVLNFKMDTIFGTIDFNSLVGPADVLLDMIPGFALDMLSDWLESEYGIKLTKEQLRTLLSIVGMVSDDLNSITIQDNGADMQVESSAQSGGGGTSGSYHIRVDVPAIQQAAGNLESIVGTLSQLSVAVESEANRTTYSLSNAGSIKNSISALSENVDALAEKTKQLCNTLTDIASAYKTTETNLASVSG